MSQLQQIDVFNFDLEKGNRILFLPLFFQQFGLPLGTAPVVVINHALTGNSNVCGENGWWNNVVGENNTIDLDEVTVIAFNIPGNGFDGDPNNLINNYKDFTIRDIARIFWEGLWYLKIKKLHTVIGGSLGGAVAWEMAVLQPKKIQNLIAIASDWKATDWVIANVQIQDRILNESENPIEIARQHAMLLYRTPQSINQRFDRQKQNDTFSIQYWLDNHGQKLKKRFSLSAYKLMNHLLQTNDITKGRTFFPETASNIKGNIHIVAVDSDYFFIAAENKETVKRLKKVKENVFYHEIKSPHGHDAFLIEYPQLQTILNPIFKKQKQQKYVNN
jgi:homoserine O-acetyltransferase/O-succinyltransferase